MKIADILARKGRDVDIVRPDSYISTVVSLLKLKGIGALVVSDDGVTVSGIISERDVVRGLAEHGGAVLELSVADLMTANVKTCRAEMKVTEAMAEMTSRRIRHLPVVGAGGLEGIISIGDVVKQRLDELETETSVLRDYIVGRS